MRVSVDKRGPGHSPDAFRPIPCLDGMRLDNRVTADEEQGLAICYKLDADDKAMVDRATDQLARDERHGVVKLEFME